MNFSDWHRSDTYHDLKQEEERRNNHVNGSKQTSTIEEIRRLEKAGVLGWEQCPEPDYWHWPVLKENELPERFREMYEAYGEIRW